MGYDTKFEGSFQVIDLKTGDPASLSPEQITQLNEFADERHEGRWPSYYCQWVPSADGKTIHWDGNEKFYGYCEWIAYLLERFLVPWGYGLTDKVRWRGEEFDDLGVIIIKNGTEVWSGSATDGDQYWSSTGKIPYKQ